jgi:hypothetical protein
MLAAQIQDGGARIRMHVGVGEHVPGHGRGRPESEHVQV